MMIYPGANVGQGTGNLNGLTLDSIWLDNVEQSFADIPESGQYIRLDPKQAFSQTDAYKKFSLSAFFEKRTKTHFQGIVRCRDGKHIILSGGDNNLQVAQLFVLKLDSYCNQITASNSASLLEAGIGTNVLDKKKPPLNDEMVNIVKLQTGAYWHAGGIGLCGDILVVPLEDGAGNKSQIRFYNVKDPSNPLDLGDQAAIFDPVNKSGACSMVRIANGHYLLAVWTDSNDYDAKNRRLSLFYSQSDNLLDGFKDPISNTYNRRDWPYTALHTGSQPQYQSIQLIMQNDNQLYMIGTENSAKLSPVVRGKNRARLYKISFVNADLGDQNFALSSFGLSRPLKSIYPDGKIFDHGEQQYNFDAACGIYKGPDNQLALYSTHHWKNKDYLNIVEFYPNIGNTGITEEDYNIIELYAEKFYKGRQLIIYGKRQNDLKNYKDIYVADNGFNDKVKSLRYKIVSGSSYSIYEDPDYNNGNPSKNMLQLTGNGQWKSIPDLQNYSGSELKYPNKSFYRKSSASRY